MTPNRALRTSRSLYLACGGSVIVAICAAMLWREIAASIACCELAILGYLQALRALPATRGCMEYPPHVWSPVFTCVARYHSLCHY
jgi:hypothetical protein